MEQEQNKTRIETLPLLQRLFQACLDGVESRNAVFFHVSPRSKPAVNKQTSSLFIDFDVRTALAAVLTQQLEDSQLCGLWHKTRVKPLSPQRGVKALQIL